MVSIPRRVGALGNPGHAKRPFVPNGLQRAMYSVR